MARAHTRPPVARSAAIVAMAAALALNGCAARGSFFQQHGTAPARDRLAGPSESYVKYIKSLPVGSHVKVALRDGERIDAVLVAADDSGVLLQPRTRIPEPERHVDISEIATIEPHLARDGRRKGNSDWRRGRWRRDPDDIVRCNRHRLGLAARTRAALPAL
jgi:hypothetical protein